MKSVKGLKRGISLVLVLSMLCSLLILPTYAVDTSDLDAQLLFTTEDGSAVAGTVESGSTVTAKLVVKTDTQVNISAFQLVLMYDKTKLTPVFSDVYYGYGKNELTVGSPTENIIESLTGAPSNLAMYKYAYANSKAVSFSADKAVLSLQFTLQDAMTPAQIAACFSIESQNATEEETVYGVEGCQTFFSNNSSTNVQNQPVERHRYTTNYLICPTAVGAVTGTVYNSTTASSFKTNNLTVTAYDASGEASTIGAENYTLYSDAACEQAIADEAVVCGTAGAGTTIYVKTTDGVIISVPTGTITQDTVSGIKVTNAPNKTAYTAYETFDKTGMVVTATYASGATADVTDSCTFSPAGELKVADTTVTVSYEGKEATQTITVSPKQIAKPTVSGTALTYSGSEQTFAYGVEPVEGFVTVKGQTAGTDAGEYTATASLNDKDNTVWTEGGTDDVTLTWTIGKGTYSGESITGAANVPSKGTTDKSYSLSSLNLPAGFVDAKITNAVIGTNDSGLISAGSVSVADGGQSITFSTVEKAKDTTGTITLTISSKNYADVTATLTLTAKDVTVDEATWNLATVDTEFVYGTANKDAVKIASGSYTAEDAEGNKLNGTLTVKNPDAVQNAGSGTITLVFTVTDEGDYKGTTVEKDVTVTVAKKEVTANWGKLSFTYDGQAQVPNATAVGVNGETLTVTVSGEQTDKGTYDATASIASVSGGNANADNYTLTETTTQFTIAPKTLTVSKGDLAYTKEYDGTTTASATGALSVDKVDADDVTVTIGSAVYADKTVGTGKTVNLSGLTLAGTKAGNYVLAADTYTFTGGVITAKKVTVSGITAENKEYDGDTAATLVYTGLTITGMVKNDQLSATAIGAFVDKNVADGKTVTISEITLTGGDAANYVLAGTGNQPDTTADITAKALTLADGTVKVTKVYDGTTAAGTLTGELALTDAIEGDTVSVNMTGVTVGAYPESGYGTYTVILNGIALTGADAANYTVPETYDFAGATITKTVPTMAMLDYALTGVTYNGSAQGVTVTAKESIEGLGAITVKYTKDGETTTTAPVNAGTYTVTASLAEGANYAAQDLELGTYTIAKANRNLTVEPTSLLLYPGSLTAQITASTDTDADKSAVITYKSANTTGVTVNAAGKVTGVSTGKVEITVAIAATTNYNAAEVKVPVTTLMDLLTGAAVTGGTGDKLTAQVADGKLVISGLLTEGETLTIVPYTVSVPDVTIDHEFSADGKTLTLKVGETVVATYAVDTSNVVTISADVNVNVVDDVTSGTSTVTGDDADAASAAVTDSATKTEGLMESTAAALVEEAQKLAESNKEKIETELGEGTAYTLKVETKITITATDLVMGGSNSFKLDIKPTYTVTAVSDDGSGKTVVLAADVTLPNSAITTAVTVSVKLPTGFPTDNLFAKHYLTGGGTETLRVTVDRNNVATWTQSSFSQVELFADARRGTVTFPFADGSSQDITFDIANVGDKLPVDTKDGYTFQGWKIDGTTYTTVTSGLLDALVAAPGHALRAEADFKENVVIGGGGGGSVINTYVITASAGEGGTISPTGRVSVSLNANKQFTIQAKDGYVIADVLVDGVSVGAVSSYTFERVNKNHTISVTFKEAEAVDVADIFWDISTSTWCYDAVQFVYVNGLMNGTTTTTFEPNRTLNRGMWVTMLYRMAGSPAISGTEDFTDVDASTWCYDALLWASRNGIVNGFDDGTFRANAVVTRQQLVAILYRYAQYMGYDTSASATLEGFVDASAVWAVEPMQWVLAEGVLAGTSATTLSPNGSANRGQAATFLMRFMNNVA